MRRSDIDWEAIERDYRVGQLSVRQIAKAHNVAPSAITRRAKKYDWSRDRARDVRARTSAKLIEIAKQQTDNKATESAQALLSSVDAAAQANISVTSNLRSARLA